MIYETYLIGCVTCWTTKQKNNESKMDSFQTIALKAFAESVTILTGIVFGEIFHRLLNIFNNKNCSQNTTIDGQKTSKRRKKRRTANGNWLSAFKKLFWRKFERNIICSSFLLFVAYLVIVGYKQLPLRVFSVLAIWTVIRVYKWNHFICPNDQKRLIEDEPHNLGEDMALGYYYGWLHFLLHKNSKIALTEAMEDFTDKFGIKLATMELLVLLPRSCDFPDYATSGDRIRSLPHKIEILIPAEVRQLYKSPTKTQMVYEVKNSSGRKAYNVAFDFPSILATSMAPLRDPNTGRLSNPVPITLRHRNLKDFQKCLQERFFETYQRLSHVSKVPIRFLEFDDEEWSKDDYSDLLVDKIVDYFEGEGQGETSSSNDD
jgi:hypothetical protein